MNKKTDTPSILLINDMAGYGKVALSVMIPMLSALRLNVYNLPTALVSNTLDYGKFDILETTDYMRSTIRIWNELGFTFDAVATGFLVSEEQSLLVAHYCRTCKERGIPVFVDPIMGDEGALYNGVTEANVEHMRTMCAVADIIMPNVTEAQYLTGMHKGKKALDLHELEDLANGLHDLGARSVVITSVALAGADANACGIESAQADGIAHVTLVSEGPGHGKDGATGTREDDAPRAGAHAEGAATITLLPYHEIPVRMPGTGDIFSSMLIGEYMNGHPLTESVQTAMDAVAELLELSKDSDDKYKGIPIERYLDRISRT